VRTVVTGTTPNRSLMLINPLGKIPTLELGGDTALYDSAVICEYLDTLHDGAKLFPPTWPEFRLASRRPGAG
jgi:glutathione S-transferase